MRIEAFEAFQELFSVGMKLIEFDNRGVSNYPQYQEAITKLKRQRDILEDKLGELYVNVSEDDFPELARRHNDWREEFGEDYTVHTQRNG